MAGFARAGDVVGGGGGWNATAAAAMSTSVSAEVVWEVVEVVDADATGGGGEGLWSLWTTATGGKESVPIWREWRRALGL